MGKFARKVKRNLEKDERKEARRSYRKAMLDDAIEKAKKRLEALAKAREERAKLRGGQ
jgi:hypothetical protein